MHRSQGRRAHHRRARTVTRRRCRTRHGRDAFIGIAAFVLAAGCERGSVDDTPWHTEAGYRWRELPTARGDQPGFTRMEATGIRFQNTVSDSSLLRNRMLGQGAGIALGDVDGD